MSRRGWLWAVIPLDQPLLLALAPAVGYLVAYLDRLGEAVALGVPVDYISVSTTDALSRVAIIIVALVAMSALAQLEKSVAKRMPDWLRDPLGTMSTWLLLSVLSLVLVWRLDFALIILGLGILCALVHAASALRSRGKVGRVGSRSVAEGPGPIHLENPPAEPLPPKIRVGLLLVLIAAGLYFAFAGGNLRASSKREHLVTHDGLVVLAIYGDRVVLGDLPLGTNELGPRRDLASLTESISGLSWSTTGALSYEDGFSLLPLGRLSRVNW